MITYYKLLAIWLLKKYKTSLYFKLGEKPVCSIEKNLLYIRNVQFNPFPPYLILPFRISFVTVRCREERARVFLKWTRFTSRTCHQALLNDCHLAFWQLSWLLRLCSLKLCTGNQVADARKSKPPSPQC